MITELANKNDKESIKNIPSLHFEEAFLIREFKVGEKYLVIQANQIEESKKFMLKNHITGLEINISLGYPNLSVEFLKNFIFITMLNVIDQPLQNTDEINLLRDLKELSLDSYFYTPIDFDNFPNLETCNIHWTPNAINLFKRHNLKTLSITSYKGKSSKDFSLLHRLENLSIINSPIEEISDLAILKNLRYLDLTLLRKLSSLHGIENLTKLEFLTVDNCHKINSIEEISNLVNLKELSISNDGKIETVKPIEKLKNLESIFFIEDTNILDGDLSPIEKLAKLKKVLFMNRKHYSHKRDLETNQLVKKNL